MKKRFCINVDKCIAFAMAPALGWSLFLLLIFLLTFFISLAKAESLIFFESIYNSWVLWLFLSGPISLVISIIISICFIFFPVSYIEIDKDSIRVHRAFKKESLLRYDEISYVRFNKAQKAELAFAFVMVFLAEEVNTIEIHKNDSLKSFWLSSSMKAYRAIVMKFKQTCLNKKEIVEGDCFIAKSQWIDKHGSPQDVKWGGHYGNF